MSNDQVWATALATAIASRNAQLTAGVEKAAGEHLDEAWMNAAKSAAAIMGMNNIYYRFVHLARSEERRVGKEGRARWWRGAEKKKKEMKCAAIETGRQRRSR